MTCNLKISPNHFRHDFSAAPSLDEKITVFHDQLKGWVIDVARTIAGRVPHSGFAVLMALSAYFETVAKYREGNTKTTDSKVFFKKGLGWVFPGRFNDDEATLIYGEVRSGLYHAGITGPAVLLSGGFPDALSCQAAGGRTFILANPHKLPGVLERHFREYVERLRDPGEVDMRRKFQNRFDSLGGGPTKSLPSFLAPPLGTPRTTAIPSHDEGTELPVHGPERDPAEGFR